MSNMPDESRFDPRKEENWHYHDEYDFWYIEFPELNMSVVNGNQRFEPSRERSFKPWKNIAPAPVRQEGMTIDGVTAMKVTSPGLFNPPATPQPAQDDSCPQCGTNDLCVCGQDDGRALAKIQEARTRKLFDGGEIHVPLNKNELAVIEAALTRPVAGDRAQKLLSIADTLIRCANILDVVKFEWGGEDGKGWTDWDRETRSLITKSLEDVNNWSLLEKQAGKLNAHRPSAIPPEVISLVVGALEKAARHNELVGGGYEIWAECDEALAALKPYSGGA